jgi:hypothetical protein
VTIAVFCGQPDSVIAAVDALALVPDPAQPYSVVVVATNADLVVVVGGGFAKAHGHKGDDAVSNISDLLVFDGTSENLVVSLVVVLL